MKTLRAFLEFCYIARRDVIDTQSLTELEQALDRFHQYRTIFMETGVRVGFNLPRQHFLIPLSSTYSSFRRPKWTMFVNHRIKTHQGCEKTVAALQPLQSIRPDVINQPAA